MVISTAWTVTCDACDISQYEMHHVSGQPVKPSLDDLLDAAPHGWTVRERNQLVAIFRCPQCQPQ